MSQMTMTDSTKTDTTAPIVSPPPGLDGSPRRPSKRHYALLGLLSVVAVAVIVASLVQIPYYRISPGSVYDTIARVDAPAERVTIPDGEIGFVTVSQTSDISVWQWAWSQLDDDVLIRHEDEINGDQTTEEKRAQDQRRMTISKNDAVVVALERLGYELIIEPTGVEIAAVFDCSAADGSLNTGDVIKGVDGAEVLTTDALLASLAERDVGDTLDLLVDRIDPANSARTLTTENVDVTLGSADAACLPDDVRADEPRAFIGIGTAQMRNESLPFDVEIDTGRVGGPSAGLAFTLAIIDVLSEGELTNGLNVVATGTIGRNGVVGPVGGIHQKTVAAERAGADVFLVPLCCDNFVDGQPSNYEEALLHAEDMRVVGVETLDDALQAIGDLGGDVGDFLTPVDA